MLRELRQVISRVSTQFKGVATNIGWLLVEKILRMAIAISIGAWIARYLGPAQFGLLSYASAIVLLAGAFAGLGLHNITVREIVRSPSKIGTIIGTSFVLQLVGGIAGVIIALLLIELLRPGDPLAQSTVAILALALLLKCTESFKAVFEAEIRSKFVVAADLLALLLLTITRILLIAASASFLTFVAAVSAEGVVAALLLTALFVRKHTSLSLIRFKISEATRLLRDSWPLVFSSMAALMYMRIDQIMLGQLSDDRAVGIYSAAVRLSEIWYFFPAIIASSIFPKLIQTREVDPATYHRQVASLLCVLTGVAYAIALAVTFFAGSIVQLLYGSGYSASAAVLIVHVWTAVFVFQGVVAGRWLIAENLQRLTLHRTLAGCAINVCLNASLIPRWGEMGAAISSVAAQATAGVIFNAVSPSSRPIFFLQLRALGLGLLPAKYDFKK